MPTKSEESCMSIWLRKMNIAFEVTRLEINDSLELKFVDYRNNCLLVSRRYVGFGGVKIGYKELQKLVKKFEVEEIYPILFDSPKARVQPTFRLIREN